MVLHLHNLMPRNGLRWRFFKHFRIIRDTRRNERVFTALLVLVDDVLPGVRLNSRPAKDQIERHLVEVVDAATRFVSEIPAMMDPMDPMAGLGLTGVHDEDFNLLEEEVSFLERAREATALGRTLTPHVFQAFFLAIIEARKRFLDFAAENLEPQDPARHSPLAQACDRFLAVAWFWDVASVPVQLQFESFDYQETIEIAEDGEEEEEEEEEEDEWDEDDEDDEDEDDEE